MPFLTQNQHTASITIHSCIHCTLYTGVTLRKSVMADVDSVSSENKCNYGTVTCELLCFLQEKSKCMTADHLVKICADFYHKDEVLAACVAYGPLWSESNK